jgi:N-acetylglucosamine-6-phosphate deacetylase
MDLLLANGRVLTRGRLVEADVVVRSGRIAAIMPCGSVAAKGERIDLGGQRLLPGFIDIQVNGGGDALFNTDPSVATIARIGAAHRRHGTTGFLPTLISDDLDVVAAALGAMRASIAAGVPGVLGAHIEGPFLNTGRRGIHAAERVRRLDARGVAVLTAPGPGRVLVTLAPEMVEADDIVTLKAAGLTLAAGHTDASFDQMQTAFALGVTGVTHLFNAMSPLASRAPGVVGAALTGDAWCGLIVDGHHVHPAVLRLALRSQRPERLLLVTDAMPCVGGNRTSFELQGRTIQVRDGACYDIAGQLAGSDLTMAATVRNTVELLGADLATASQMASGSPAAFLGLGEETGRIAEGLRADLVLLDDAMEVVETWIAGVPSGAANA